MSEAEETQGLSASPARAGAAAVRFTSHSLGEVFRDLFLGERTGVLELRHEDAGRRVHFSRGLIHFAESIEPEESLGAALVRDGLVAAGAVAEAERGIRSATELPQALLKRDLIATEPLRRALRTYVDGVIRSVFTWAGGEASFEPGEDGIEVLDVDVLSTFEQILDGIARMSDFATVHEAMGDLDNRLRMRRPSPVPLERMTLSRIQGYVLSRIDGGSDYRSVLSTVPPGEEERAARFLFGLLLLGVLEFAPPLADGAFRVANVLRDHADRRALERMQEKTIREAYGRLRNQNPHEILGVSPSASRRAIERAYEEAKAIFGRERLLPRVRDRFRAELGVIESRLVEAYLQLTQIVKTAVPEREGGGPDRVTVDDLLVRPDLDKTRTRLELDEASRSADLYYSKARQAARSGDYHNAIQFAKLAITYNADDARYFFLLGECQARNPEARWQRLAEQNFTKATQLDPWNVEYWVSLGRFYKKRGMTLRARKQFEEALKLAPGHEVASRELASLG